MVVSGKRIYINNNNNNKLYHCKSIIPNWGLITYLFLDITISIISLTLFFLPLKDLTTRVRKNTLSYAHDWITYLNYTRRELI